MISHFEGDFSSSPDPGSSNVEVIVISIDSVDGEGIFLEGRVCSLEESVHCVSCSEEHSTFTFSLIVSDDPKRPTINIDFLE